MHLEKHLAPTSNAEDHRRHSDELEETPLSDLAKHARDALSEIIGYMEWDVELYVSETSEVIHLDLETDVVGLVIGRKGQTLEALQYIVNKIVNRDPEHRKKVLLDVAGYRERRRENVISLARRLCQKAQESCEVVKVGPMSAEDRRLIHMTLNDVDGISTRSEGDGLSRRLLIIPEGRNGDAVHRASQHR